METSKRTVGDVSLTIHTVNTVVIGAGVAGLNAAERLHELGCDDFAVVTTKTGGASGDPPSAKSTYYRMGMSWDDPDSPASFAKDLCEGGMTHGDLAYVEAVNSIPAFLHLAAKGVPFPRDEYGTYLGAGKHGRVASAGPQTSAVMAEKSLQRARRDHARILNRHTALAVLVAGDGAEKTAIGVLAVDLNKASDPAASLVVFNCLNVVLATGGVGAAFEHTVHTAASPGGIGLGIKAGAAAANLTETRFGLTIAKARRPLAGNYQRAIPSYYSVGKGARTEELFLANYFHATKQIASAVFLKGEHWPFSTARLQALGPSIIDIAVHKEIASGRRVYVNFSQNIKGQDIGQFNISQLDPQAREFLEKTGTVQFSPYDRLRHLDPACIDALLDFKVDLREPQEVALCAEDTFGGLAVDASWETNVHHLFAVGDVACTHGNPPDGAELNAGQVGGIRAAERIVRHYGAPPLPLERFLAVATPQIEAEVAGLRRYVYGPTEAPSVRNVQREIQERTSAAAGMIRGVTGAAGAIADARRLYDSIRTGAQRLSRPGEFVAAVENELLCLTQLALLESLKAYIEHGGGSRGAYLILDERGDATVLTRRGAELRHRNENMGFRNQIVAVTLRSGTDFAVNVVPVRPIPTKAAGPLPG